MSAIPKPRTCELEVESIIVSDGVNPREEFQEQDLFALAKSMDENTQLQPIIVNRVDGKNYLVAGERRLRAARASDSSFIEAKVFEGLDPLQAHRMTLAENRDRKKLNILEEARGMAKLADFGLSDTQIAKEEGVSLDTVRRRLQIIKLPEEIQEMMTRKKNPLPIHQALLLKNLSREDAVKLAKQAAPAEGPVMSEDAVRDMVNSANGAQLPFSPPDDETQASGGREGSPDYDPDTGQKIQKKKYEPGQDKPDQDTKVDPGAKVKGSVSAVCQLVISDQDGYIYLDGATVTVRAGDAMEIVRVDRMLLDLGGDHTAEFDKVFKLIKQKKSKK